LSVSFLSGSRTRVREVRNASSGQYEGNELPHPDTGNPIAVDLGGRGININNNGQMIIAASDSLGYRAIRLTPNDEGGYTLEEDFPGGLRPQAINESGTFVGQEWIRKGNMSIDDASFRYSNANGLETASAADAALSAWDDSDGYEEAESDTRAARVRHVEEGRLGRYIRRSREREPPVVRRHPLVAVPDCRGEAVGARKGCSKWSGDRHILSQPSTGGKRLRGIRDEGDFQLLLSANPH
jgi:hypothetical protein